MAETLIEARVAATRFEALGINSFELNACDGSPLPDFTAGSHIDVHLPSGLIRHYSLVNAPGERHRYRIAVSRDPASKGGSEYLFEHSLVGQTLRISAPRNNFLLREDAAYTVLIAGGIGITPIYCMLKRLRSIGAPFELHYAVRNRVRCAFLAELEALPEAQSGRLHFHFDEEQGCILDLSAIAAEAPKNAHLYCCGPIPMLEAFKASTSSRAAETIHLEYFKPAPPPVADDSSSFTVTLASTGQTFTIPAEASILDTLIAHGVEVDYGCQAGACGTCCTGVIKGIPDHHDHVMNTDERAANDKMMICVSRSKSENLVLDL